MMMAQLATDVVRPGRSAKRDVSIWELLVWAFQREKISIEFEELSRLAGERPGVGMEYILMQRHNLGCSVDGGGRSEPHPDADLVSSALAVLPDGVGGRRMAVWIASLAQAGKWPEVDCQPEAKCEPVAVRRCKHGVYAERTFWSGDGIMHRWPKSQLGKNDGFVCLVRYTGTARDVASQRRAWLQWRGALLELKTTFQIKGLTAFAVNDDLPPLAPWKKKS